MTAEATVFVEENERGWWQVRVRYAGAERPFTLVVVPTEAEAVTAARGYSVIHDWRFEQEG